MHNFHHMYTHILVLFYHSNIHYATHVYTFDIINYSHYPAISPQNTVVKQSSNQLKKHGGYPFRKGYHPCHTINFLILQATS